MHRIRLHQGHHLRTATVVLLALCLGLGAALAGSPRPVSGQSLQGIAVRVVDVYDGGVLLVAFPSGQRETVRLAGIDVPSCTEREAIVRLRGLALDELVSLELAAQQRDQSGNLVGYVWSGSVMLNQVLVAEGLAVPTAGAARYQQRLDAAGAAASSHGRGGWGEEGCLS